ncbi:M15 family metallopeptidase [Cellulomonas sp. ACRRI]|uniref:M15 family metallopeptidase n=1 Tax=Cellulomonas sp. ACRRI TaxID=2918188 RepID=UPI001EF3AD72|nr:M15 family metallopeptidase [Cellulomonas sp. ACRRI]MCG7286357.1 M15 family metallopeptidase [Cellulomonas sp. ACRRI]
MTEPGATPPTRRAARARRRGGAAGRGRAVVAGATSAVLVAGVAVAGVQLHEARERAAAAEQRAEAIGLSAELAAVEDDFLAERRGAAVAEASRQAAEAGRAAREQAAAQEAARVAAEQAAAEAAAAAAEAARAAEEQAAADAARASAGTGSGAPAGAPSGPGIAGWVDGRPVDAQGNVLWVTSVPTADGDGSNGHMPASAMCQVPWGTDQLGFAQYLRCDAADALTALNEAFRAQFGAPVDMDLTYRSYEDQVAMKAAFGGLAAAPGTSSHGLGTALDVQEWPGTYGFGTARYDWLVANGPTYGWYAPARVRQGQPYAEYWHFEYGPGRTS